MARDAGSLWKGRLRPSTDPTVTRHLFRRSDGATLRVERDVWLCALDLALRAGWKPRGVDLSGRSAAEEGPLAYFPPRGQRVTEEDAREIGEALQGSLAFVNDRLVPQLGRAFGERNTSELLRASANGQAINKEKTDAALELLSGPPKKEAARLAKFLRGGGFTIHAHLLRDRQQSA